MLNAHRQHHLHRCLGRWRHSRYLLAWRLSNTLEDGFCAEALEEALAQGQPEVFNTDQASQFTSWEFIQVLRDHGVRISMDGKARYSDNIWKGVSGLPLSHLSDFPGSPHPFQNLGTGDTFKMMAGRRVNHRHQER